MARSADDHESKVDEAAAQFVKAGKVFDAIMHTQDKAIPRDLLTRAKMVDRLAVPLGRPLHDAILAALDRKVVGIISHTDVGWGLMMQYPECMRSRDPEHTQLANY